MIQVTTEDGVKHLCDEILVGGNNMLLVTKDEEVTLPMNEVLQIRTLKDEKIPDHGSAEVPLDNSPRQYSPL